MSKHIFVVDGSKLTVIDPATDAVIGKVSLIVECARVSEIAGEAKFRGEVEPLAVTVQVHRLRIGRGPFVDGEAQASLNWKWVIAIGDLFGLNVDALAEFVGTARKDFALVEDVGGDLQLAAVGEIDEARVGWRRDRAKLDPECAEGGQ